MWLQETPTISFEFFGKRYGVKDLRVIPEYTNVIEIDIREDELIDEIASDPMVYGEGQEDRSYVIFEANAAQISDNNFSLQGIKKLKIPV